MVATIGDMLRMDESGRFTTSGRGSSLSSIFKAHALPDETFHEEEPEVEAVAGGASDFSHDQVSLKDIEGRLCGYYELRQTFDIPEQATRLGDSVTIDSRPTTERRLALLRGSFDNPSITSEQKVEVAQAIDAILSARVGRRVSPTVDALRSKSYSARNIPSDDVYVVRDANGLYLGVQDIVSARRRWGNAELHEAVIAVDKTVPFREAKFALKMPIPKNTGYSQRVDASLRKGTQYAKALSKPDAEKYWRSREGIAYRVLHRTDKPICTVPYGCLSAVFDDAWIVIDEGTVQIVSTWEDDEVEDRIKRAESYADSIYKKARTFGSVSPKKKRKKAQQPPVESTSIRMYEFARVLRDERGCFLGVFGLEEAVSLWSDARPSGSVIVVPYMVEFADAVASISHTKDFTTEFKQAQYRHAIAQASKFPEEHVSEHAGDFWKALANTRLQVHNDAHEIIAMLTPSQLDEAFGTGWFLYSLTEAQVVQPKTASAVAARARAVENRYYTEAASTLSTASVRKKAMQTKVKSTSSPKTDAKGRRKARKEAAAEARYARRSTPVLSAASTNVSAKLSRRSKVDSSSVERGPDGRVSFDGPKNTLYIFKGTLSCVSHNHKLEAVTGIIVTLGGNEASINVNYCHDCNKYFLGQREYEHYRDKYGPILGNFSFYGTGWATSGSGFDGLSPKSLLNLCGYNVGQSENLSSEERQLILANVIDRDICSKPSVMSHLQWLINTRESNPNMRIACEKWKDDLDFIRNYHIDRQRRFAIRNVQRNR